MKYDAKTGRSDDNSLLTDFYIERDFDDSEIRLLLDSVIFSPHLPQSTRNDLIVKIERLSNAYFKNSTRSVEVLNSVTSQNKTWFYILSSVNDAIIGRYKLRFTYNEYGIDKQLHPV